MKLKENSGFQRLPPSSDVDANHRMIFVLFSTSSICSTTTMFEVPWCQFPKQEGCLLWFVIQDQPTLLFVICDCSTSTQGKFVIGFLLFVIKELSSQKTRRYEDSSNPSRSIWWSSQRTQWLQFRIISDSSIIQRKRRSVTVWYDEFRCTGNLSK